MEDDWAARQIAKDRREAQEAANASEKSERGARLKDEGGMELFKELHAWMEGQAKSYSSGAPPAQAFEVGKIERHGGPDCHDFFKVSSTKSERLPMTISYRTAPAPHGITIESSVQLGIQYPLSVGDNGNLLFETPKREPRTIEQLGSELLSRWIDPRM